MRSITTLLGAGLMAWSAAASAQEPVTVKLGDLAQSLNAIASQAMIDQGLDKKHGFKVEYVAYPTLDGLFTAIRGKQVDVGFGGWTAFSQFRAQGFPTVNIFPVGRGATLDIIVPKDSPIKSVEDLKGKKVGSYAGAAGTATVLFRVLMSKYYGFDPGKTNDMQYSAPGLLTKLVQDKQIDAALLFDPLAAKAVASGEFRSIANLGDLYKKHTGKDFLWITYASNDDFIKANPQVLTNFNKAWVEAVDFVMKNDKHIDDYGKKLGLSGDGLKLLRDRVRSDYIMTWTPEFIAGLGEFASAASEVMGKGYLDNVPKESFSTEFVAKK